MPTVTIRSPFHSFLFFLPQLWKFRVKAVRKWPSPKGSKPSNKQLTTKGLPTTSKLSPTLFEQQKLGRVDTGRRRKKFGFEAEGDMAEGCQWRCIGVAKFVGCLSQSYHQQRQRKEARKATATIVLLSLVTPNFLGGLSPIKTQYVVPVVFLLTSTLTTGIRLSAQECSPLASWER